MRYILVIVGLLITMTVNAEIFLCSNTDDNFNSLIALSVSDQPSGLYYNNKKGYFEQLKGYLTVSGDWTGRKSVSFRPEVKADWENSDDCYVVGDPVLNFSFTFAKDDKLQIATAKLQRESNFVTNPDRPDCTLPQPLIVTPKDVDCRLL